MSYIGNKLNSRVKWTINPVSRIKNSKKKYDRKTFKKEARKMMRGE